ncbi:MAG TPA: fused MFS/spermidine synthase [Thermoanaerobaculia bacterium]|nr:fused MFS/spermidine synthase [Thermoanaerobaculia bacterium]
MNSAAWRVAGLLFFSGACALIYQTAWMRQFRLIFGASTFATAAVLAVFMGGLGLGSAVLGKRADRADNPLRLYARLELAIAMAAAISPALLWLAAKIYWSLGGSPTLGLGGASVVRLVLSLLVLGIPTFLMGGTLPAAARAIQGDDDSGRRAVALLYGLNTLGAVAGTLLSTFVLLEHLGNRQTLFAAVAVNLIVALTAMKMTIARASTTAAGEETAPALVPAKWVYAAAAIAGFAFLLMELVWYRMLSPLLGGTTYMFGLILAVALLGIGLGGAAYALLRGNRRATAGAFAVTCALEALAIGIPFALGDRLATLTLALSDHSVLGLAESVVSWTIVTLIVVFPAAFVSGVQFPLLVALLGRGRSDVGREVGTAYAWNTAGAIAGSLAGGFGLMPLFSAPGCWQLVVTLLALLAAGSILFALREQQRTLSIASAVAALLAVLCLTAAGPTAVWRHSGIGAGRATRMTSHNTLVDWMRWSNRRLVWDADGRESGVALTVAVEPSFIVNGKSDGSARSDAGTQVMAGLVAGAFHGSPSRALVVGLGTGSSAGWLGAVDSMKRVDVVELEPVVLDVARVLAPFNHDAMRDPKIAITIADAREVLLTSRDTYDIIVSEPSNPFRAGIASLFTREFYQAVEGRLAPRGVFAQWVQTYDIDPETMRTIYATVVSVFPNVHTWTTTAGDALLVASNDPLRVDVESLRALLAKEPYRSAMRNAWGTEGVDGLFARFVANEEFARQAARQAESMNTDDRTVIEFGFARSVGIAENLLPLMQQTANARGMARPLLIRGTLAPETALNGPLIGETALQLANEGREEAAPLAERLRILHPPETESLLARLRLVQRRYAESAAHLRNALVPYRTDPWPDLRLLQEAVDSAVTLASTDRRYARAMYALVERPYAGMMLEDDRRIARVLIASQLGGCTPELLASLADLEPYAPFREEILTLRARCYTSGPLARIAKEELEQFRAKSYGSIIEATATPQP